jgi:hypothetical protein
MERNPKAIILVRSMPEPNTGCWLWFGATNGRKGYGRIIFRNKKHQAHRFSYEAFVGPIPSGLFACHKCDNPACVNPDHIFLGTNAENQHDKVRKGRQARGDNAGPRLRRETRPRGEAHSNAKLTNEKVIEIREKSLNGMSAVVLAKEYGVSEALIYKIRCKECWAHI